MALNTYSPNTVIESAKHNADHQGLADGTNDTIANSLATFRDESFYDFVASGCLWTADSVGVNRNASMSSGTVYIGGTRVPVSAVTARTFTASKDTYIDVDNTGALTYTEVANNAASPALAVNNMRLGIITTDGTKIAAAGNINQGQTGSLSPTISSAILMVADSLGNLIYNKNPRPIIIGYSEVYANQGTFTTEVDLTGLYCSVIVPANKRIAVIGQTLMFPGAASSAAILYIKEGSTYLQKGEANLALSGYNQSFHVEVVLSPSSGIHTYKLAVVRDTGASGITNYAATTAPAFIKAMLL